MRLASSRGSRMANVAPSRPMMSRAHPPAQRPLSQRGAPLASDSQAFPLVSMSIDSGRGYRPVPGSIPAHPAGVTPFVPACRRNSGGLIPRGALSFASPNGWGVLPGTRSIRPWASRSTGHLGLYHDRNLVSEELLRHLAPTSADELAESPIRLATRQGAEDCFRTGWFTSPR